MTPEKHAAKLRQLAEEARATATCHVDSAAKARRDAEKLMNTAIAFDGDARLKESEAANWDAIASALDSGAITLHDGQLLTEVRSAYAAAHEAINPELPFAKQREQLAAADLTATHTWSLPVFGVKTKAEILAEAAAFEAGDEVNVADPEHGHFGTCGVVLIVRDNGLITIAIGSGGDMLTVPPASLMHHAKFVAQMDAAEQQAADDVYTAEDRADDDAWTKAAALVATFDAAFAEGAELDAAEAAEAGIEADL